MNLLLLIGLGSAAGALYISSSLSDSKKNRKCCVNCRHSQGQDLGKYNNQFICAAIGEARYDNYKKGRNTEKDCICKTYYNKANYFEWKY